MNRSLRARAVIAGSFCLCGIWSLGLRAQMVASPPGPFFVENRGQWDPRARFLAQADGTNTWLTDRGFVVHAEVPSGGGVHGVAVRMTFEASASEPSAHMPDPKLGHRNYLFGGDASEWVTGVRSYRRVRYPSMYPGVDLVVREQGGVVEYDLEVAPWADLGRIVVRCGGHEALGIDADGTLVIATAVGELRQKAPKTWTYDDSGGRHAVQCRYRLIDTGRYGFCVDGWSRDQALTIDPGLVWSTYLGGSANDEVVAVGVASNGDAVIAGETSSAQFPTTAGAYQTTAAGRNDMFVTRLLSDGSGLVFSTYFGSLDSSAGESLFDLRVASDDTVYVSGETTDVSFPVTPDAYPASTTLGFGSTLAFISQLDAAGASLAYSTLFGGLDQSNTGRNRPLGLFIDEQRDRIYVAGDVDRDIPATPNAVQPPRRPSARDRDAFLVILDRASQPGTTVLHYGTNLGGSSSDGASCRPHVDPNGVVTIAGRTTSADFPVTAGAFQTTGTVQGDVFVCRIDPSQSGTDGLVYSSYFGGDNFDEVAGVAIHRGRIVFGGTSSSSDWPTTPDALRTTNGGRRDGIVTIIDPAQPRASSLVYSTYLGGEDDDRWLGFDLSGDLLTLAGVGGSPGLPATVGAFQPRGPGAYLAQLDLSGIPALAYATYFGRVPPRFGHSDFLEPRDVASAANGELIFGGQASDDRFPITPRAFQRVNAGGFDGFVARIDPRPLPSSSTTFGFGCPGSAGVPTIVPPAAVQIGQPFTLSVTGLPVGSAGALSFGVSKTLWGTRPLPFSLTPFGAPACNVYVSQEVILPLLAPTGTASFEFTVPNEEGLIGAMLFAQFASSDPSSNSLGVATSNASESTVRR